MFLDEIGDMSAGLQAKLLRVLEERRFRRVGGTRDVGVDIRVVAATNRGLRQAVDERVPQRALLPAAGGDHHPAAEQLLQRCDWPGNVRELRNVYPPTCPRRSRGPRRPPGGVHLVDVEREFVRQALEISRGKQTRSARLLGLTRDELRYRMKKFGLVRRADDDPGSSPSP